jgi:periplasmic divalent cation tolerance protein
MEELLQAFMTVPTEAEGRRIAQVLVEERLAACVQMSGPIESTYRWQGRVEHSTERLCLVKTSRARFPALKRRVTELHPYDVPEIIAVPIAAGNGKYLDWLLAALHHGPEPDA